VISILLARGSPYAVIIILLGVGMSFFVLLPTIFYMQGNPGANVTLDIRWLISPFNIVERFRVLFFPKLYEESNTLINGTFWGSNAVNIPVIGMLCAILYCIRYKDWLKWVIITCLVIYLTPLNGAFSGFTMPPYSRWVYALTLFVILASMRFLDSGNKIKTKEVGLYALLASGSILLAYGLKLVHPILENTEQDIFLMVL